MNNKNFHEGANTMSYSRKQLNMLKESAPGEQKTHYEFWGKLSSSYNLSRAVIAILSLFIIFLFALLYLEMTKPNLVFKVDGQGVSSGFSAPNASTVYDEELVYNTTTFINLHNDLNPFSVEKSLNQALQMCANETRKSLLAEITSENLIETAIKYKPTCQIELGNITFKKKEHPYYETFCIVNINYIKPKQFLRVHTYDIIWKKGERTNDNPSGLYIVKLDHYDQGDIKKPLN